jgi:hypothetical protein
MRKWLSAVGSLICVYLRHLRIRIESADDADERRLRTESRQPTTHETHNWPLLYALVIGELTLLIIIFYAFTKAFA